MTHGWRGFFVTGTDTGVGKTVVSCALIRALREMGSDVGAMKPVETGVGEAGPLDAIALREAGIKLSVTVLLGIAGRERSLEHARATGALLSAMDPNYVGALTVMLIPGTPLHEAYLSGKFVLPDERELLLELKEMIAHTNLSRGLFFSNHASNYLPIKARLPKGKQAALDLIDGALTGDVGLRPEWMRAL